jgi:hypothetical protein
MSRLHGELLGWEPDVVELVYHERSKHIDLRYHIIQNCLAERIVSATYINTTDQLANILMKALWRVKFQKLRASIGMVQVGRDRDQGRLIEIIPCPDPVDRLYVI